MNKGKLIKCVIALAGILFISVGVSFNAMAQLGNDPVGIFYDGIRAILHLDQDQLGTASNIVNIGLILVLFLVGRRYINIGTIIYIVPYGLFVKLGTFLYGQLFLQEYLWSRIAANVVGCLLLYTGVAIFIAVDIGLDPMTGLAMVISNKMKWDFRKAKIAFDVTLVVLGVLLGGKLGVVTIVTAVSAGPVIQFIAEKLTGISAGKDGQKKDGSAKTA